MRIELTLCFKVFGRFELELLAGVWVRLLLDLFTVELLLEAMREGGMGMGLAINGVGPAVTLGGCTAGLEVNEGILWSVGVGAGLGSGADWIWNLGPLSHCFWRKSRPIEYVSERVTRFEWTWKNINWNYHPIHAYISYLHFISHQLSLS